MSSMLERLPTVEEMMIALSSPVVPEVSKREDVMELSTDDMIKEMFTMMNTLQNNGIQGGGGGSLC
jgi:hypothetical protein